MAGNVKLMTSAGGGVVLDTATTTATDVTVKVPVTGVNNGTLVCSDSSGNVGIGTSTIVDSNFPLELNAAASTVRGMGVNNANGYGVYLVYDNTNRYGSSAAAIRNIANSPLAFETNNTERMRIDSSGNLLVNQTSQSSSSKLAVSFSDATNQGIGVKNTGGSGGRFCQFLSSGGSEIGSIQQNGSSAVSYVTSSDYRLKENIQPMQNALGVVQQLNPVTYTWKADGSDGQGFIAHELQAVVPDCVTGEKDAVDEEGNPVYQGIDTSFLVATLTKAIQELSAKNDALEARIATLEAK